MTKLDFNYDQTAGEEIAFHNGYRIRAVRDGDASNPFDDFSAHWPFIVRSSDGITCGNHQRTKDGRYFAGDNYEHPEGVKGASISRPLERFTNEALVHNQIHIAKVFGTSVGGALGCIDTDLLDTKYCRDGELLRDAFDIQLDSLDDSNRFGAWAELLRMVGCVVSVDTERGHCQGDWVDVITVATPEAIEHYGCLTPPEELPKALEAQAGVYGSWAFGDCYGYVIERPTEVDEDGDVVDWEEIDDGSCWGYYGDDHDESGLADAALEAVPAEPAEHPTYQGDAEDQPVVGCAALEMVDG